MSHSRILDGKEKLGHPWFNKTQNTSLRGLLMNKQEHYAAHWVKSLEPNSRVNQLRLGTLKKLGTFSLTKKHSGNISAMNYQRASLHSSISVWDWHKTQLKRLKKKTFTEMDFSVYSQIVERLSYL